MYVASPPALPLPTPLPVLSASLSLPIALSINPVAVPSTSANASANMTGQPTLDPDVTDTDTTLPSDVSVFTAPHAALRSLTHPQPTARWKTLQTW